MDPVLLIPAALTCPILSSYCSLGSGWRCLTHGTLGLIFHWKKLGGFCQGDVSLWSRQLAWMLPYLASSPSTLEGQGFGKVGSLSLTPSPR